MANKIPTPTHEQEKRTVPDEDEVRQQFQREYYIRPVADSSGHKVGRLDYDGPAYPGWTANTKAERSPGEVRIATESELDRYNQIIRDQDESSARMWLNEEWK